jgi:hypothetical protein
MSYDLNPVKRVLRDLKEKIAFRIETMGHPCSPISPELGSRINFSEIEQARCWMFATDHYLPLMMKKPRERRIPPLFLDPDSAFKWYDEWFKQAHDLKIRFNIIPCPNKGIILLEYLHELAQQIVSINKEEKWWESLASFVNFIRQHLNSMERGFLNDFFPAEMDVQGDLITRIIQPQRYPIDQFNVAKIIQSLVTMVLTSRKNAQKNAAQALGLLWVCLTGSFLRLTLEIKQLRKLSSADLKLCQPFPSLSLLTPHGEIQAPISRILHDYLQALCQQQPQSARILSAPQSCLDRTLRNAIKQIAHPYSGEITFLTFMSLPQEISVHRYQRLETTPL